MRNILVVLFLTMLSFGCKPEGSYTAPAKVTSNHNNVSTIKLLDNYERAIVKSFLSEIDSINGSIIEMKVPASKVSIVYMEHTPTKDSIRLKHASAPTEFEALLLEDTLYLKFFERSKFKEGGIRVKAIGSNFSTSYYLVADQSEFPHNEMRSPQPFVIVENYVRDMAPHIQSISLNKENYQLGDTILGEMYYEGRQGFDVIYANGQFKGIVREGKQTTPTLNKKH